MSHVPMHSERTIVDPSEWDSTEVGGDKSIAFQSHDTMKKSKVSSLRSSLFVRHAPVNKSDQQTLVFHRSLVFQQAHDAESIQSELSFETRAAAALRYCDFGKANKKMWAKDVLAFFHNALRYEVRDLTTIMRTTQRLGCKLTVGHLVNVRMWWRTCAAIVEDYMDMEVKVLEPWIAIALDGHVKDRKGHYERALACFRNMPKRQSEIRQLVETISHSFSDLCESSKGAGGDEDEGKEKGENVNASPLCRSISEIRSLWQKTMLLMGCLDALVVQMATHMHDEEVELCQALTDKYKREKKGREALMGKGLKMFVRRGRKRDFMVVLVTRWMGDDASMVESSRSRCRSCTV